MGLIPHLTPLHQMFFSLELWACMKWPISPYFKQVCNQHTVGYIAMVFLKVGTSLNLWSQLLLCRYKRFCNGSSHNFDHRKSLSEFRRRHTKLFCLLKAPDGHLYSLRYVPGRLLITLTLRDMPINCYILIDPYA